MSETNGYHGGNGAIVLPATAKPDRLPPHSIEAEQGVLCSIILDNEVLPGVAEIMGVTDLFRDAHQLIYQAILDLGDKGEPIDNITLHHELELQGSWEKVGGYETITTIINAVPTAANALYYAGIVREKSNRRRAINGATDVINRAYSGEHTTAEIVGMGTRLFDGIDFPDDPEEEEIPLPSAWPDPLGKAAFEGPIGEIVRTIEPHTSADPAATLIQLLVMFGSVVGRGPRWYYEAARHSLNLYLCLVGKSSRGGKGTSWEYVKMIARHLDPEYRPTRLIRNGMCSGEGFIEAVRDARFERRKPPNAPDGIYVEEEVEAPCADKRVLWAETEFGGTLSVMARDGNTLSAKVRDAWDSGCMQSGSRNRPLTATDGHVSIIGHITMRELSARLSGSDISNGFGNRFLWACVKRSKYLPMGGRFRLETILGPLEQLERALAFAKHTDWSAPIGMSPEAVQMVYREFPHVGRERAGILDDLTARAEAQVRRIAAIYALVDCTTQVQIRHLEAALAVWEFCDQSVSCLFGEQVVSNPEDDKLLKALATSRDGLTPSQIRRGVFKGHKTAKAIAAILGRLVRAGSIRRVEFDHGRKGGNPGVRWTAVQGVSQIRLEAAPSAPSAPSAFSDDATPDAPAF